MDSTTKFIEIKSYFAELYPNNSEVSELFCSFIKGDDVFNFFINSEQIIDFMKRYYDQNSSA